MSLFLFPEGLHIIGATSEYADLIGAKVLKIAGKPADLRREVRQTHSKPHVEAFRAWAAAQLVNPGAILDHGHGRFV